MQRTSTGLWLALALGVSAAGCTNDVATPTQTRAVADRQSNTGITNDARDEGDDDNEKGDAPFTYAVIGDFPYGATKRAELPALIAKINADPAVERVLHVGDIKAGTNSDCSDAYFADIKSQFDTFEDPLVYTPGDNEWTDCHKAIKNNGVYKPTERLAKVREMFFPVPGRTLGIHSAHVQSQGKIDPRNRAYVENVMWQRSGVVFASLDITGSNDDTAPWTSNPPVSGELPGLLSTYAAQLAEQPAEIAARYQANSAWLERTFRRAQDDDVRAVVLMFQADMWDGTLATRSTTISAYDAMVVRIGALAAQFGKPVLMIVGDSHVFKVDQPYVAPALMALHPNTPTVTNLTRLIVNGSASRTEYVRLTIDPRAKGVSPFSFVEVPLN